MLSREFFCTFLGEFQEEKGMQWKYKKNNLSKKHLIIREIWFVDFVCISILNKNQFDKRPQVSKGTEFNIIATSVYELNLRHLLSDMAKESPARIEAVCDKLWRMVRSRKGCFSCKNKYYRNVMILGILGSVKIKFWAETPVKKFYLDNLLVLSGHKDALLLV